jgi:hypothetical protein
MWHFTAPVGGQFRHTIFILPHHTSLSCDKK